MDAATQLAPKFGGISRAQQAIATALRASTKAKAIRCRFPYNGSELTVALKIAPVNARLY
jgi:hypothetical protein